MTYEETKQLLSAIRATYPKHFSNLTPKESENMLAIWTDILDQDEFMLIMTAFKSYARQNASGFPPTPGQLIDIAVKLSNPKTIDADGAWSKVRVALRNSIYHANEEFEKLPEEVQAGVGSPSQLRAWAMKDEKTIETATASVFKKNYGNRVTERKEFEKLPNQAKKLIQGLVKHIE